MDKRLNRREFLRLAVLASAGSAMAACVVPAAPQPAQAPAPVEQAPAPTAVPATKAAVELSMWSEFAAPPQGPVMDSIIQKFNDAHPGITIKHTKFENTPYETAIKAAYAGGEPPDISEINGGGDTFQYAGVGELEDLTDFAKPLLANAVSGMESVAIWDSKYWAVLWEMNIGNVIWTNSKILADQGIKPESLGKWSGFLDACEKLKTAGITPIAFGNKEAWNGNHWYTHLTRRMLSTADYVAINVRTLDKTVKTDRKWTDPEGIKAWEYYRSLLDKGYFSAGYLSDDYAAAYTYFLSGKAAFFQTGTWFLGVVRGQSKDFPLDYILFPELEGYPGKQADIVTHSLNLALSKRGQHKEEAKQFLQYMTTEEPNRIWSEGVSGLVPYKFDSSSWKLDPILIRLMADVKNAPSGAPFLDVLEDWNCNTEWTWNASVGILSGDLTPQQAAEGHEKCVQDLLKKKGYIA